MAIKNAQQNAATKNEINTPVFVDGSALTIPTLSVLKADGSLKNAAKAPKLSQKLAKKIYSDRFIRALSMNAWSVHSDRGG